MKRIVIALAVMALAPFAAQLFAGESTGLKMVKPDWHYRWHEGRWWYWVPESSKWMVWSGSIWVPLEKVATCGCMQTVSQTTSEATSDANVATENANGASEPSYSGGGGYEPGYSSGAGSDYSGYGWGWGPGTAFRDSPGRRF